MAMWFLAWLGWGLVCCWGRSGCGLAKIGETGYRAGGAGWNRVEQAGQVLVGEAGRGWVGLRSVGALWIG
jgi:hypothetical protein